MCILHVHMHVDTACCWLTLPVHVGRRDSSLTAHLVLAWHGKERVRTGQVTSWVDVQMYCVSTCDG